MAYRCKGLCTLKYGGESGVRGWFRLGYKKCRVCHMLMKYDGRRCPCCGGPLSITPKRTRSARRYRDEKEAAGEVRRIE